MDDYIHNPIDIKINEVLHGCSIQTGVGEIICSMLSSLRSRIIVLFLLSFLASGGALLYALSQFVQIGQGLYAINACYLPVSDETTKLDIIVFQLQREQERIDTSNTALNTQFINASFYIEELEDGLERTQRIIQLARDSKIVDPPEDLNRLEAKAGQTLSMLEQYSETWREWQSNPTSTQQLNKAKSQLVVSIRQLASMVSVQMIQVSQQTELARRNAQRLSGTLTLFATLLWIGLLFVALRVVKPITQLTEKVQRVKRGEMVQITERGISSEISELYENFNEMANTIQERDRTQRLATIGKMLAQITHEIRNPLNAMSLNVEMLLEEPLTPDGQEMLDILKTEIDRLEKSTNHYLTLAKPPELNIQSFDPMDILTPLIQYEHYELTFHIEGVSMRVNMDENILRRCFRNLFRNALEANAQNMWITFEANHISVQDDGEGFIEQDVPHAFEPFYTTKSAGTGLGLSICRQELELCGASLILNVETERTTFTIQFPTTSS